MAGRVRSPVLTSVLDWHRGLCTVCQSAVRCAEYLEIIEECGAGLYGDAVFFPDERTMVTPEQQVETRGGESPRDWQVNIDAQQYRYEHYDPGCDVEDTADD